MSCIYQADGSDRNAARTLEEANGREEGEGIELEIEDDAAILSMSYDTAPHSVRLTWRTFSSS